MNAHLQPQSPSPRYTTREDSTSFMCPVKVPIRLKSQLWIKGRTESELLSLPSTPTWKALRVFNVRPAYVDPPKHHRPRPLAVRLLMDYTIAPVLRQFMPSQVTPTGVLSKVLVDLVTGDGNALQQEAESRPVDVHCVIELSGDWASSSKGWLHIHPQHYGDWPCNFESTNNCLTYRWH